MKSTTTLIFAILSTFILSAQDLNNEILTGDDAPYLLGKIDKSGLQGEHYASWFKEEHSQYEGNNKIIEELSTILGDYKIMLFMGTWCSDSQREVPRLYKILEACNYPMNQLTVVALSREANLYKQSPQHEEEGLNIHRVPTIIFYKDGKEVNRIIEEPIKNLEEDILNITTNNSYKSYYHVVTVVDNILKSEGIEGLKKHEAKLLDKYKAMVYTTGELNTYGRILFGTERVDESIAVFELNTKFFPDETATYMSLANTLGATGQKDKAIKVLQSALEMHPDDEDLKENLEVIKNN
ncbi:thioredoxin family protein [Winogradskyella vincentii]|uniref:Thioredoxin family protein n=1 Tax=Winogradskyella vincentii TaxID=2877122 RepID=A0ABS7Y378_9FLAO|nr:thioredoxin family protein [Winogradskyella vincentii]MCA0154361.1 thioredoxin family protein [Winogradskyella vincentii]